MRPVTDRFKAAIYESHEVAVDAYLITPSGYAEIDVIDGTVTLDGTADSRGSCDLVLPHDLAPSTTSDALTPYGNEILLSRGIRYPDGTSELVRLGFYRIEDVTDTGAEVRVTGLDRSANVIQALFETTVNVSSLYGSNIVDAIRAIITEGYPQAQFRFGTSPYTVPADRSAIEGNSRWEACQALAEAVGCVLYFDADGYALLRPAPVITSAYSTTITTGQALMDASREFSRSDAKNRWIVTGETSAGEPLRGEATDDNPFSPTRYGGPFGKAPDFYSNEYINQDDDQAAHIAATRKALLSGISQTIPVESLVNPAIEPYDVVRIVREEAGIDQNVILDAVTIPLGSEGTMSVTTTPRAR